MNDDPQSTPNDLQATSEHLTRYESVQASVDRSLKYVDIAAAIMLSIATVATAWCAYQSSRWSGVQAAAFAEASALRVQSNTAFNTSLTAATYDTITFIEWLDARNSGDEQLVEQVLGALIRDDFEPYIEEFEAALESGTPSPPIENEAYGEALLFAFELLEESAIEKSTEALEANQNSDDYVLSTVIFATVLFFAGISGKFVRLRIQGALVAVGAIMLAFGFVQIAGLPIH